jgi:hypothetical protein
MRRRRKTLAQKHGENDSVADNITHPERPWYEPSNKGPTAAGRGTMGNATPRRPAAAKAPVPSIDAASDSARKRRLRGRSGPATQRKVLARVVRKASGGVLRRTDASVKRSPRARRP